MTNKKDFYEASFTSKPYLILDLDDTMSELLLTWLERYNKLKSYDGYDKITPDQIKQWDLCSHPKIECDIFDLLHDPSIFEEAPVKKDARKYLNILSKDYEIFVVSSCNPDAYKPKWNWLRRNFKFINPVNFIACTPKYLIKSVPGSIMVDDKVSNLCEFEGVRILMAREYNHPGNYGDYECEIDVRCNNWKEVYEYIKSLQLC